MNSRRLEQILDRAPAKRLLVLGDLMLDEFVWGKVGRISPEAPVPVVQVTAESFLPGGAANVARNLREFTECVSVAGMIGHDHHGYQLRQLLAEQKIDILNSTATNNFCTIVKTRIIARHQQVVRVDREQIAGPSRAQLNKIVVEVEKQLAKTDAIIFEDYGKGFLSDELITRVTRAARRQGKIVTADPNATRLLNWRGMTAVKPNRTEAFLAAGIPCRDSAESPERDVDLARAGKTLLREWDAQNVLITLGEQGMMLFQPRKSPQHIPTKARQVFDVSGAGDTAIALFTLALACGATPLEAAEMANHASAVVVGKLGTATVSRDELMASFQSDADYRQIGSRVSRP
ncbi:MAG TPA: PfkB family carbohydrate kinase [Chthoniobacterales bacterium]|jgi:D-beta-D-heptose 7-phosphate kinase/D-beta-D-heptose 1-phosphate adenosyltransferase|nr:PfkB family carbohydrate kinase [Chthoniobacterales bacterium]